jgi:hypothetical protein
MNSTDDSSDANSPFADEPNWGRKPSHAPRSKPPAQAPRPEVPIGGEYEVEGVEPDDDVPPPPRAPLAPKRAARPKPIQEVLDEDEPEAEANVEEIWTRWGEWGPSLTRMGIVAVVTVLLLYFVAWSISVGFLMFVVGFGTVVALSYPIAITLERPMRLTPEQAVKDYYAAASHHFPQFRRMWLLLSEDGRDSPEFDSFASFRSYWIRRMAQIRGDRIKKFTPLTFVVKEFRSDKSAGQTVIEAEYTVAVHARGQTSGSAEEYLVEATLARGPDKMWYLNSGILPAAVPAGRGRGES